MLQLTPAGRGYALSRIAVLDDYRGYALEMAEAAGALGWDRLARMREVSVHKPNK